MKKIRDDISKKSFSGFYLLYGIEDYMRSSYKKMLIDALMEGSSEMNLSRFEGKQDSFEAIIDAASTLPFFGDHRVVLIDMAGLFTGANDLADRLTELPDTTVIVFVEKEADKRTKLYKFVKENGYVCEFTAPTSESMANFIVRYLEKNGKKISKDAFSFFVENCATDMLGVKNELDKLISYTGDRDAVTVEDIGEVCVVQVEGKIFEMTDAIALGDRDRAIRLYMDLIALREKPMGILSMIRRHFMRLLEIHQRRKSGSSDGEIASAMRIPPFAVKKYNSQLKLLGYSKLKRASEFATDIETDFKSGKLTDQIGVEIMIVKLSSM